MQNEDDLPLLVSSACPCDLGETLAQCDEHFWHNGHSPRIIAFADSKGVITTPQGARNRVQSLRRADVPFMTFPYPHADNPSREESEAGHSSMIRNITPATIVSGCLAPRLPLGKSTSGDLCGVIDDPSSGDQHVLTDT
jgi:hypothetical protein